MNAIAKVEPAQAGELQIFSGASVFDVARYEQVDRVATVMAAATLIPDHLKGQGFEQTKGNCFMICNLAANWELDPFAVAQASALVFGKIVLEGKLVRAVINRHLGFDLHYRFFDEGKDTERVYVWEKPFVVKDGDSERPLSEDEIKALIELDHRITPGTFAKWHTKAKNGGVNDNWIKDRRKMMRERGAREWCREFAPGLMLGVYTVDEFDEVEHTARSSRARDITPTTASNPLLDNARQQPMEVVDRKTGEVIEVSTGAQSGTAVTQTPTGRKANDTNTSAAPASEKPSSSKGAEARDGGGSGSASSNQTTNSDAAATASDEHGQGSQASSIPGEQSTSHAPLSRDVFRRYVRAIGRSKKEDTVASYTKQFLAAEGIGALSEVEKKLFAQLRDEFVRCVLSGRVATDAFLKEAEAWIVSDIAEEVL